MSSIIDNKGVGRYKLKSFHLNIWDPSFLLFELYFLLKHFGDYNFLFFFVSNLLIMSYT